MDYLRFAELRRPHCDEFEKSLAAARQRPRALSYEDLEALAFRYRQLLHDHALAAARYPGTAMARRLRRLVLEGTHWLQRDTGEHLPSVGQFLTRTFPGAVRRSAGLIALAAGLFALAGLFGFTLTTVEPGLGAVFLSPEAVDDLRYGRLWTESIFAVTPGSVASTQIATNNMAVAITGWAGGALAGLLGLYVILLNGLMLGCVLALTAHFSMAGRLGEFIAAHGPLEISLILVTAAAGLGVGRALVVATDRPRSEQLRDAGRDALVVLLGCLPWLLLLGLVEGFLSPAPEVPVALKVTIGLLLELLFVLVAWNPLGDFASRDFASQSP